MADRLRGLWDFGDLDTTERRLREQLAREADDAGRAEVLTQLARVEGLRGDVDAGERSIEEAAARAGKDVTARARIDLERGRLRRSSGDPEAALPLFASAFETSLGCWPVLHRRRRGAHGRAGRPRPLGLPRLDGARDRARGGATTGPGTGSARSSTTSAGSATSTASTRRRSTRSSGPYVHANGTHPTARRSRSRATRVGKALRALGRSAEAVPLLEHAVAWAQREGAPDGWFHEELAEEYAALGRANEAREQARLAVPLLLEADPSFAGDGGRAARLRSLAAD